MKYALPLILNIFCGLANTLFLFGIINLGSNLQNLYAQLGIDSLSIYGFNLIQIIAFPAIIINIYFIAIMLSTNEDKKENQYINAIIFGPLSLGFIGLITATLASISVMQIYNLPN